MTETAVKKAEALPGADTSGLLVGRLAKKYSIDARRLLGTLRDTVFLPPKGEAPFSDNEMAAALVIADKYDLDVFTRQIHITRSRGRLLVVVGIDGWVAVCNREPLYDGMDPPQMAFDESGMPYSCTISMWVKGRKRPTVITEYFEECRRDTEPWKSHPRRMLRHRAYIQCARLAFGIAGLLDEDEAAEVIAAEARVVDSRQLDKPTGIKGLDAPKYLEDAVRIPPKMARRPEVQEVVESARLPEGVPLAEERREAPVVDSREEPAREPGENEEPGGNPLEPTK